MIILSDNLMMASFSLHQHKSAAKQDFIREKCKSCYGLPIYHTIRHTTIRTLLIEMICYDACLDHWDVKQARKSSSMDENRWEDLVVLVPRRIPLSKQIAHCCHSWIILTSIIDHLNLLLTARYSRYRELYHS